MSETPELSETPQKATLVLDLDELLYLEGASGLNDVLDEHLINAGVEGIATDISYDIVGLDENKNVQIEATYYIDVD